MFVQVINSITVGDFNLRISANHSRKSASKANILTGNFDEENDSILDTLQ